MKKIGKFWVGISTEPRDAWVGAYIKKPYWEGWSKRRQVYICILPFVPILIEWEIASAVAELDPPHSYGR